MLGSAKDLSNMVTQALVVVNRTLQRKTTATGQAPVTFFQYHTFDLQHFKAQTHIRQRLCFLFKGVGFFFSLRSLAGCFLNSHTFFSIPCKEFFSFAKSSGKSCLLSFLLSLLYAVFSTVSQDLLERRVNNSSLLIVARIPLISVTSHFNCIF